MNDVDSKVRDILAAVSELQDLWHFEQSASAWPTSGETVNISGTGTSDPTGKTAASRRTGARDHIAHQIDRIHQLTCDIIARERPTATGEPCKTSHCEGHATHAGRCERCDRWMGRRQNRGFGEPDKELVEAWNSQRYRDCECPGWCCPDGCLDRVPPGSGRRVSERCHKRKQRTAERAAS